jgi:hypothetical protein
MEAETHPDPFREAINHGLARAMQVASFAGTAAQVFVYHQKTQARAAAEQDERARRALLAQTRAEREAGRSGWSPALDPRWLRDASLHDTARAWGAALPYADRNVPWYEPAAATAVRKTEERLRHLHPFAMARYDRLRADGLAPAEAMQQTAPLFALRPRARDWPFEPRPVLDTGTSTDAARTDDPLAAGSEPGDLPGPETLEARGQSIITALQERARAERREPLGQDELRTVLETVTNLPASVIDRITRPAATDGRAQTELDRAAAAERARAASLDKATDLKTTPRLDERTANLTAAGDAAGTARAAAAGASRATQAWERDFPVPIDQVVAAATASPAQTAAPRTAPSRPAVSRAARPGGPGHG